MYGCPLPSEKNKGLYNNYLEGGWEIRGGERGGLDVKFNTYRGSISGKVVEELLEFKYKY